MPERSPAQAAFEKFQKESQPFKQSYDHFTRCVFGEGWNAALKWIPVRIDLFRELETEFKGKVERLEQILSLYKAYHKTLGCEEGCLLCAAEQEIQNQGVG